MVADFFTIIVLYLFFILSCFCISYLFFDTIAQRKIALKIFFLSSFLYFLFSFFAYWAYTVNNNCFFQYPDQDNFYEMSQYLGELPNVKSIFDDCFTNQVYRLLTENQGAYFYSGLLSYVANHYLGGNNVLFQILNVSFLAALIPVFVFRILLSFVSIRRAFLSSVVFIFCSYVFYYSPWILRDIHIALLYSIGLSILYTPFKVYRLLLLCILSFITFYFRAEHGLFMLFMPLLYVYEQTKKNKIVHYSLIGISIVIIMGLSIIIIPEIMAIQKTLNSYQEFTQDAAEEGGLGKYIYRLPMGLKELVAVLYSQMSPFPSWGGIVNAKNFPQLIIGLVQIIAPAFWFIVWFCVIQILRCKDYRSLLPNILILSGFIFLAFLIANSSNINPRRLICMYPVFYIFYVIAKENYPFYMAKNMKRGVGIYFILCIVYLFIKL